MSNILGLDESGRGAALSDLVMYGVVVREDQQWFLRKNNVKDSKLYTNHMARVVASQQIKQLCTYTTESISAQDIDFQRQTITLNEIERDLATKIIRTIVEDMRVSVDKVILDGQMFEPIKDCFPNLNIVVENHADKNHLAVAAASVCAKAERDKKTKEIMGELHFGKGRGYPNENTAKWVSTLWKLKNLFDIPKSGNDTRVENQWKHIRKSWKWYQRLEEELKQEYLK